MGCLDLIAKYLFFSATFAITLIALCIIGLGATLVGYWKFISEIVYIPIIVLIAGCIIFLIASCGCCGTFAELRCLLVLYIIPLVVMMACYVYGAVQLSGDALQTITRSVEQQLDSIFANTGSQFIFFVLEGLFKCCGTTGPQSYDNLDKDLSPTCCRDLSFSNIIVTNVTINGNDGVDGSIQFCPRDEVNSDGCNPIVVAMFTYIFNGVYYVLVALIVMQLIGILSSIYLSWRFGRKNYKQQEIEEMIYVPPPLNPAARLSYNHSNDVDKYYRERNDRRY